LFIGDLVSYEIGFYRFIFQFIHSFILKVVFGLRKRKEREQEEEDKEGERRQRQWW
jgi:ammonia channel protein AmtB